MISAHWLYVDWCNPDALRRQVSLSLIKIVLKAVLETSRLQAFSKLGTAFAFLFYLIATVFC